MRIKRYSIPILLIFTATWLAGCASIMNSPMHDVRIDSTPQNANFTVVDEHGEQVAMGVTPDTVVLRNSSAPFQPARYYVNFDHENYPRKTATVKANFSAWYFMNFVFGGSWIGALIVDPYTGTMYKLPNTSSVVLSDLSTSETDGAVISEKQTVRAAGAVQ